MRFTSWGKYQSDTFLLLYPTKSDNSLRRFSRNPVYFCPTYPFCTPLDPPKSKPRLRSFINNGRGSRPSSENSQNCNLPLVHQENTNEQEEENLNTDIIIPMSCYLSHLVEQTLISGSNFPVCYSKHYPLYHLWNNHLVHLE